MSAPTLPVTKMTWPADLIEVARNKGVEHQLDPLLEMTQQMFPDAQIEVILQPDPDIADWWFIIFDIRSSITNAQQFLDAHDRWHEERLRMFPGPDTCLFVCGLHRARP